MRFDGRAVKDGSMESARAIASYPNDISGRGADGNWRAGPRLRKTDAVLRRGYSIRRNVSLMVDEVLMLAR